MNLKPLVNNHELYTSFLEWVDVELEKVHKGFESCPSVDDLYRLQGRALVWNRLKKLREEVNGGART